MARIQPVRGTHDLQGDDARRFAHVLTAFSDVARRFGFEPIAVPIFEFTEVFARSMGESSDVVSKEMYSLEDRGGESLTLRPEFTAGIARAYLSNGWQQFSTMRVITHGPVFRYERPQKGRYRQFHQIDAEIIGAGEPAADVDLLAMASMLLDELGLRDEVALKLNTLGDTPSRQAYRAALVAYFEQHRAALSDDSRRRLETNPLRILDSKDAGDRALLDEAPRFGDYLTGEAQAFYDTVRRGLDALGIAYKHDPLLVRGLDYYSHTAFEFVTERLGAQGTVLAGGRYDGLIEQLGGAAIPGIGWAGGIERLASLMVPPVPPAGPFALVPLGSEAEAKAPALAYQLRYAGLSVDCDYKGNMKKRLARADKRQARAAILLGEDELARGAATVRDLTSGAQDSVALDRLAEHLKSRFP